MKKVFISCQCGSRKGNQVTDKYAICKSCGTKVYGFSEKLITNIELGTYRKMFQTLVTANGIEKTNLITGEVTRL